jgi:hypothetical protein
MKWEVAMRKRLAIALVLFPTLLAGAAAVVADHNDTSARLAGFSIGADHVSATLKAGPYRVTETAWGQRIEIEGFRSLAVPGRPQLPMKRFLVALPPGARARSVEIVGTETSQVPGVYRIEPFPQIMPLPDAPRFDEALRRMRSEWQTEYDAVYASDSAYPRRIARLLGSGTLRKYAYVSVGFCPFTYYPQSGRLEYHSEVEIVITYEVPPAGSREAQRLDELMSDRVAEGRASGLFSNYGDIADLYSPDGTKPAPLTETYDYVIITTADLQGAITASDFPVWKAALGYSLKTVLITDTEITSQPGADLAEQIRNFLRAYYVTWGIEYVLLVGDYATVPMRICYPDPDFHVYDPSDPGLVAPGTPTDHYYADLSLPDAVSWDSDGDGYLGEYGQDDPDFLAEVAVGRIPVNDTTRIRYSLDKLVTFEEDAGAWKTQALLAGAILFFENQNYGGYPFIDGATCLDSIETGLMGGWTVSHYSEQAGLVTSLFPWPALTEAAFTTAWGTGEYAVVNWSGHGWCDGAYRTVWAWDDGDGVPESGNGEMQSHRFIGTWSSNVDDDHPSIIFAISCNVGYPDPNPYGNLGIDMLTMPGWGPSAGVVSSSRPAAVSGDWKASPGGTESICFEFNRYMISEAEKVGDALYDGKFYAHTNYGWDRVYEYMNLYNFNLYGDPALEVAGATAGIAGHGTGRPEASPRLGPSEPNPFRVSTALRFALPVAGPVRIAVHSVTGQQVTTLTNRRYEAGESIVTWDGTDDAGEPLSPGIYFVRVRMSDQMVTRKVVLVK